MKKVLLTSAVLSAVLLQSIVHAEDGFVKDYVTSPYGEVYKNSYGECWRSRFDDTNVQLEECGYKKLDPIIVIEKELIAKAGAMTMTTTVADEISIKAALLFDFDSDVLSDNAKDILDDV